MLFCMDSENEILGEEESLFTLFSTGFLNECYIIPQVLSDTAICYLILLKASIFLMMGDHSTVWQACQCRCDM